LNRDLVFWTPQFGEEEKSRVTAVIDSGFLNDGKVTEQFERRFAELLGSKHVIATTSGTSAIFLVLSGIGVGPGDEVIVPDVTFIATANAVSMTGAKPVLVDIDPQTLTLDPTFTERVITTRTKAIIPVHVSGRAAKIGSIMDIAKRHGLLVVEDAAEALMSRYQGKCLGTFGIAGCFSLSPNKSITTGQGGLIATDDDLLHCRLRELKDQGRPVRGTGGDDVHNSIGYNFKFTDLQAAIGLAQLGDLRRRLDKMKSIYRGYADGLGGIPGISILPCSIDEVLQWTDVLVDRRDELFEHLVARGIHGRRFWHPLHTQIPYRMSDDQFPHATKQVPHAMWLPSALTLSDADVASICEEIRDFQTTAKGFTSKRVSYETNHLV
jgi:perosamine synthetase